MLQKVITGEADNNAADSASSINVTLKMRYNKANQLISMTNGADDISYSYDRNGSMVKKVLNSRKYGKLTDMYTYNALDQLTAYTGYDGYQQQFTYDANGMRQTKREKGNAARSTLEELLRGSVAGLPEIIEPTDTVEEGYEWATTEYLYDITQEYYQVIRETCADNSGSTATAYAYGLERIAGYTADTKTTFVYDGRNSVAQTITAPIADEAVSSTLPDVSVQAFTYTAYGEQIGEAKLSGFTYNAEAFDAAMGMLNLRARQYEPTSSKFCQKDVIRGQAVSPISLNQYAYCVNSPVMHTDPSGESVQDSSGNWWNKAKQTTIGNIIDTLIVKPITSVVTSAVKTVIKSAAEKAAKEYDTKAFLLFSSILQKVDSDGIYYSDKFRDVVESMQDELAVA